MGPSGSRKFIFVLVSVLVIFCAGLAIHYPAAMTALAQDEPTDRPFPTAVTTTTVPDVATSASGSVDATPTERPFPSAVPTTPAPASATGAAPAATAPAAVAVQQTPTLTNDSAVATITAMQAENKNLQDELASAQGDKGATVYALVVVVIGLAFAFAVFFGLKQSGR